MAGTSSASGSGAPEAPSALLASVTAPVTRSRTNTADLTPSGSPRAGAPEKNTAKRPSALSAPPYENPPSFTKGAVPAGREMG